MLRDFLRASAVARGESMAAWRVRCTLRVDDCAAVRCTLRVDDCAASAVHVASR
jgi:hypothetical protein